MIVQPFYYLCMHPERIMVIISLLQNEIIIYFFFDPQKNKFSVDINTLSENPIIRIGVIKVGNTTPVELKINTCSIAFNGGKSRKRRTKRYRK